MTNKKSREEIDLDLEGMADPDYQEEALAICNELSQAKWEAFKLGELESKKDVVK